MEPGRLQKPEHLRGYLQVFCRTDTGETIRASRPHIQLYPRKDPWVSSWFPSVVMEETPFAGSPR